MRAAPLVGAWLALAVWTAACGDDAVRPDGGGDAGPAMDARVGTDAEPDSTAGDASEADASTDATSTDAASTDAAPDGDIVGIDERPSNPTCTAPSRTGLPTMLSETGCFDADDPTQPLDGLIPFDLNAALWSDAAEKDRWLAMPDGTTIEVREDGDFLFPIGTVFLKTFRFGDLRLETRLFVRHEDGGWAGYAYKWNDEQTDAELLPPGPNTPFPVAGADPPQDWTIPSREDCLTCHQDAAFFALGPEIGQLNRDIDYPSTGRTANQLRTWEHIGLFAEPLGAEPEELATFPAYLANPAASVEDKARSYLHINCGFCHRPTGGGRGPDDFRATIPFADMHICGEVPTRGDLGITDPLILAPGEPDRSILLQRMLQRGESSGQMPPLASDLVDEAGTGLIRAWILSLTECPN